LPDIRIFLERRKWKGKPGGLIFGWNLITKTPLALQIVLIWDRIAQEGQPFKVGLLGSKLYGRSFSKKKREF
jgi:hypothetical protein